jgi:hypothetical protein
MAVGPTNATPASTLRNTGPTVRIKTSHMGERKTIHVLYIVFQKWWFMARIYTIPVVRRALLIRAQH